MHLWVSPLLWLSLRWMFSFRWVSETVTTTLGVFTLMKKHPHNHTHTGTHASECVRELSAPSCRLICFCIRLLSEEASLLPLSANISSLFLLLSLSLLLPFTSLSSPLLLYFPALHLPTRRCLFPPFSPHVLLDPFSSSSRCFNIVNLFFINLFALTVSPPVCVCVWGFQSRWQTKIRANVECVWGHQSHTDAS